jgi:hypothetical protein
MQIRIRESGAVMYEDEFRKLNSTTSFPQIISVETLNDFGADPVLEGPQAQPTHHQIGFADGVEQINSQWYTKYSVSDMNAEAIVAADAAQAANVRTSRNDKLKECDWTQIADSTADKATWATYRQALRDITKQTGFPWTIDWPEVP